MSNLKKVFNNSFDKFRELSDDFELIRDNEYIATIKGFFCSNEYPNSIQTVDKTILKENDILLHTLTNAEYTIYSLKPLTLSGELNGYIVEYKQNEVGQNVYNIQSVSGNSAIGTNATFNLISQSTNDLFNIIDKELPFSQEKTDLLNALLELKSKDEPIDKNTFSKFSDLIKKHENLLIPIGTLISKILFSVD